MDKTPPRPFPTFTLTDESEVHCKVVALLGNRRKIGEKSTVPKFTPTIVRVCSSNVGESNLGVTEVTAGKS
jgi:hypothetical protein